MLRQSSSCSVLDAQCPHCGRLTIYGECAQCGLDCFCEFCRQCAVCSFTNSLELPAWPIADSVTLRILDADPESVGAFSRETSAKLIRAGQNVIRAVWSESADKAEVSELRDTLAEIFGLGGSRNV